MLTRFKGIAIILFVCALLPLTDMSCYAQREGRGGSVKADTGAAEEGAAVEESEGFDDETVAEDEGAVKEEKAEKADLNKAKAKVSSKKEPQSKESLLDRETKRHENQMKSIRLMKKKASEQIKKAEEMEAKELQKHDENVEAIKSK